MRRVQDVRYEVDGSIARVTIDRPERRNAMSFDVMQGLRESAARARADDAVRVLVLTGAGDKAFCAGADLGGIADTGAAAAHDARGMLADLFRDLWRLGKPTIARVRGYALAGGFGLALACDFVVAADDAQFGTPEVNVGLWPYMITVPLLRSMPPKRVLDMDPDDALAYLQTMLTITSASEDTAEGVAAFAEKRNPKWKGR